MTRKPMRAKCALCGRICPIKFKRFKHDGDEGYMPYRHSHTGCRDGSYTWAVPFIKTEPLGIIKPQTEVVA